MTPCVVTKIQGRRSGEVNNSSAAAGDRAVAGSLYAVTQRTKGARTSALSNIFSRFLWVFHYRRSNLKAKMILKTYLEYWMVLMICKASSDPLTRRGFLSRSGKSNENIMVD